MKLTFLGTGTSVGVPTIGCKCKVCTSNDPHDKRLRASAMIETDIQELLSTVALTSGNRCLDLSSERLMPYC